jgi:uncharacterized protein YrrD
LHDLLNCAINATDGPIGRVKDCYFDDETWIVRYLVVDTGTWLSRRKVLIAPLTIGTPNWAKQLLPVGITKQQVADSPDVDTDRPVSRQHERTLLEHYDYPCYWSGSEPVGPAAAHDDYHLRSFEAIAKYHIHATDGSIGHVSGVLFDEQMWAIRYLLVNTSDWWVGHQVLIAPQWIEDMRWDDRTLAVSLTRDAVKNAPPYDAQTQVARDHEIRLHSHYRRHGYWANEVTLENPEFRVIASTSSERTPTILDGITQ